MAVLQEVRERKLIQTQNMVGPMGKTNPKAIQFEVVLEESL
jgi:hypothetical protein